MADSYYSPHRIRYSRAEILWIIEFVLPLEAGEWPPEPIEDSGYIDSPGTRRNSKAPYETACLITGEVWVRLEMAGEDGGTLVHEVQHGLRYYESLCPAAQTALNYISGWRRRRMGYKSWVRQRKYLKC